MTNPEKTRRAKGQTKRWKAPYPPLQRRSTEALGLEGKQFQPKTIQRKRVEPTEEEWDD